MSNGAREEDGCLGLFKLGQRRVNFEASAG